MQTSYRKPKAPAPAKKTGETKKKPTHSIPDLVIRPVEAKKIISSQPYQRAINQRNVMHIKEGYIKELVNPVKVSLRNGKYYCFDGQHTLAVLTDLFGENCIVPCLIYTGLTYEQEADLFAKQDEFKRKLSSKEKVKANYEAADEDTVKFVAAVEKAGFKCDFHHGGAIGSRKVGSIDYLFNTVYKIRGEDHLIRLLSIIRSAWSDEKAATQDAIIKGLDVFMTLYEGEYNTADLVAKLQKVSPVVIIRNGKASITHVGATRYAIQIFDVYNKGRKTKLKSKF